MALLLFDRRHQLHVKRLSMPPLKKLEQIETHNMILRHKLRTSYHAPQIFQEPCKEAKLSYQNTEGQTAV